MTTATVPRDQHPTPFDREAGLAAINRYMVTFAKGMHAADPDTLVEEAGRLEGLPTSPVIRSMRLIVDSERAARRAVA